MNILLIILGIIVGVIVLVLIIALFIKKSYSVQRSIVIDQPKNIVFDYLKHLKNQDYFSKWVMMDPNMQKTFKGTDGAVGFVYAWEGNKKAGKGEQEIKSLKDGELIDVEVRFEKPIKSTATTPFGTTAISANQTKVTWGMNSRINYPLNIMCLFVPNMLEKDMDESLGNLKRILEKK